MLVKVGDGASIQTISAFNYDLEGTWDCGTQTATLDCDSSSPALTVVCPSTLVPGSVMDLHLEGTLSSDVGVTHPCVTVTFDLYPMATVSTSTFALTVEIDPCASVNNQPVDIAIDPTLVTDALAALPTGDAFYRTGDPALTIELDASKLSTSSLCTAEMRFVTIIERDTDPVTVQQYPDYFPAIRQTSGTDYSYETMTVDTSAAADEGTYTVKVVPFFLGYESQLWDSYGAGHYVQFDIVIAPACGQVSQLVWNDPSVPTTLAYQLGTGEQFRDTFSFNNPVPACPIDVSWKIDYGDGNGFVEPLVIHETLLDVRQRADDGQGNFEYDVFFETSSTFFDPTGIGYPNARTWDFQLCVDSDGNTRTVDTSVNVRHPCRSAQFT